MIARIDNRTQEEVTNSLAQSFPRGRLFQSVNIEESNLRKLLIGLSFEIARIEEKISKDVYEAYFINEGNDGLLEEWESAIGIPDDCFSIEGLTRDERINNVLIKLSMSGIITEEDYEDLGTLLGVEVKVQQGGNVVPFPLTFPSIFASTADAAFMIIIQLPATLAPTSVFTFTFPFTFADGGNSLIECIFNKIKPANVKLTFAYNL
jgi:uncharacterized protein YmfQ (DUF2313 family)